MVDGRPLEESKQAGARLGGAFHGLVLGAPQRLDCEGQEREEGNELGSVAAAWRMKKTQLAQGEERWRGGVESGTCRGGDVLRAHSQIGCEP